MCVTSRTENIVVEAPYSLHLGPGVKLRGARGREDLKDLDVPARLQIVNADVPARNDPAKSTGYAPDGCVAFAVGQLYQGLSEAVLNPTKPLPDWYPSFDVAVKMHKFLDLMRESSRTGQTLKVPKDVQY